MSHVRIKKLKEVETNNGNEDLQKLFSSFVNTQKNPFLDFKETDNIRRALIKNKYIVRRQLAA